MKDSQSHLTLSQRNIIEQGLNNGNTFTTIAAKVNKDPSTISKEIRKHRVLKQHKSKPTLPKCVHIKTCTEQHVCQDIICHKRCNDCVKCYSVCSKYEAKTCGRLEKPPYVCNGCPSVCSCPYHRFIYVAKYADDTYRELLSSSREGINQTPEDMQKLDELISPLIMKGQSLAHIYANHNKEITIGRRTLYTYISKNVFSARNIDLPRKVKYKPLKSSGPKLSLNRQYCIGRAYKDFKELLLSNPGISVVDGHSRRAKKW